MTTLEFWDLCRNLRIPTVDYTINPFIADEWIAQNQEAGIMTSKDFRGDIFVKFLDKEEHYIESRDGKITYASKPLESLPIELFQLVDRLGSGRINFYLADDLNMSNGYRVIDYEE